MTLTEATSDCPEKNEMSSHLSCSALMSRCLQATESECAGPSAIENRMGETRTATISSRVRFSGQVVILVLGLSLLVQAATQKLKSIPIPGTKPFPESVTSTSDGVLFDGRVGDGGIVRVKPRTGESTVFVQPGALGSRSILGVFTDEASNTLWACSNDLSALGGPATGRETGSALKGFDLTPTSVARIGTTAWVSEGQLAFFFDPSTKDASPSLPFRIYAVPLRKEDTE